MNINAKNHKYKYYRVKKVITRGGTGTYKVEATESKFNVLFNIWSEFEKENKSLSEAIKQIDLVDSYKLEKSEIVWKTKKK